MPIAFGQVKPYAVAALSPAGAIGDHLPALVVAAQAVLDEWQQDENGQDVRLGTGGPCEDIACALVEALAEAGLRYGTVVDGFDEHADVTLVGSDGVWRLDIPWEVYEIHHGMFQWKKIQ